MEESDEVSQLRAHLKNLRNAMVAWAHDQHDGHIYEDARGPFNKASRVLGLPECDRLGVPAEVRQ